MVKEHRGEKLELEKIKEENRHKEFIKMIDVGGKIVGLSFRYLSYTILSYIAYRSVDSVCVNLGGHDTRFLLKFITETKPAFSLGIAANLGLFCWAKRERSLRLRVIERYKDAKKKEELHYDPDRTSSSLTSRGETNMEERI